MFQGGRERRRLKTLHSAAKIHITIHNLFHVQTFIISIILFLALSSILFYNPFISKRQNHVMHAVIFRQLSTGLSFLFFYFIYFFFNSVGGGYVPFKSEAGPSWKPSIGLAESSG